MKARWTLGWLALVGCGALVGAAWLGRSAAPAAAVEPTTVEAPRGAESAARTIASRAAVGRGGTLAQALERLDVAPAMRVALLAAIDAHVDPRRVSPHSGVVLLRDARGGVVRFAVRVDPAWFVRAAVVPGGRIAVERVPLAVTEDFELVSVVIEDTVAQALAGAPRAAQLAAEYADIFQWDVDLFVDPRAGDEVRLVRRIERLREAPADLPSFGDGACRPGDVVGPGRIVAASYRGAVATAHAFRIERDAGADYYGRDGRPLRKSFLRSPLNFRRISSHFSGARRHPITRRVVPHHGIDYAADSGTPVVAAADGRVTSAGWDGPLGRAVRVRHPNGYVTVYGHLRAFAAGVRAGAGVAQNQVIGFVGATGRATGPHLHYAVLLHGRAIDPLRMENPQREPLPEALHPRLEAAVERWGEFLDLDRRFVASVRHARARPSARPS